MFSLCAFKYSLLCWPSAVSLRNSQQWNIVLSLLRCELRLDWRLALCLQWNNGLRKKNVIAATLWQLVTQNYCPLFRQLHRWQCSYNGRIQPLTLSEYQPTDQDDLVHSSNKDCLRSEWTDDSTPSWTLLSNVSRPRRRIPSLRTLSRFQISMPKTLPASGWYGFLSQF